MHKIFLVGAYYPYEGTEPVRAFATIEEAEAFKNQANDYHRSAPVNYRAPDYEARVRAWEAGHPAGSNFACESYEVEEVPFGPAQRPIES